MTLSAFAEKYVQAARSAWQRMMAAWASASQAERATAVLLGIMIVGGIVIRIRAIWYPTTFTFDEPFFVPNAQNYLLGLKDTNDHPPLFKMFMSVGILLLGFNSAGWRFPALCFGILSILLAYWLGKAYFRSARAGLMAAAFVAADGFFISYSRVGLMDGDLTCLLFWTMLAAVTARTWRGVLVTGFLIGIAASVKWSGVFIVIPAVVTMLLVGRVPFWSLLILAVAPMVQAGVWLLALRVSGEPTDLASLWQLVRGLVKKHVEMNHDTNPLNSSWYSWIIFYRPVIIKNTTHGLHKYYASTVGNPVFCRGPVPGLVIHPACRARHRRGWWHSPAHGEAEEFPRGQAGRQTHPADASGMGCAARALGDSPKQVLVSALLPAIVRLCPAHAGRVDGLHRTQAAEDGADIRRVGAGGGHLLRANLGRVLHQRIRGQSSPHPAHLAALVAWGARRLRRRRTIVGGHGNPFRVPISEHRTVCLPSKLIGTRNGFPSPSAPHLPHLPARFARPRALG
jgi:hypothetical protein